MRISLLCMLGSLLCIGCSSAITLRHPDGRQVQCGPYSTAGALGHQVAEREARCVDDYQAQGFRRVP